MPSNHLILCHPLLLLPSIFPIIRVFPKETAVASDGQSTGVLASALVLLMNVQGWFPLGWTGWFSLQSKGLSRVFSNTTVQKHQSSELRLRTFIAIQLAHVLQKIHPWHQHTVQVRPGQVSRWKKSRDGGVTTSIWFQHCGIYAVVEMEVWPRPFGFSTVEST